MSGDLVQLRVFFTFFFFFVLAHLGYLQDQDFQKASEAFCKSSQYLREEYDFLKRGLKIHRITDCSLIDSLKEYSEIRSIGKFCAD